MNDSDRTERDYGEYKILPDEREDDYDGYEKKPDFTFDEKSHVYKLDGKPMTGVTSVIGVLAKPALIGWAAKMATEYIWEHGEKIKVTADNNDDFVKAFLLERFADGEYRVVTKELLDEAKSAHTKKKEAAGSTGTDRHAEVEEWINLCLKSDGKPNFAMPHTTDIKQFVDWAVENVDHFLFSERRMFNKELFIAGTADFAYIGKDGKRYMADFKTSSGIYGIDYWLQCAAYRMLAEGEGDEPYDGATIVRLGKDGSFEVNQLMDYVLYKEAFLACLTLYRLQAHNKGAVEVLEKTYPKNK